MKRYASSKFTRYSTQILGAFSICFFVLSARTSFAIVLPMIDASLSPVPTGDIDNTTIIHSYTTASGTMSDLAHAITSNGSFSTSPDGVRNTWGAAGVEINGPQSVLNLDISTGLLNSGDIDDPAITNIGNTGSRAMNFFFSQTINSGVAGNANDFFIIENGGNDLIEVLPLDATGNPIPGYSLTIDPAQNHWGQFTTAPYARAGDGITVASGPGSFWGVAFDIEDFVGPGTVTGVRGIAISGETGLDALVIGVNSTLAPVIEMPTIQVDRITGAISINNPSSTQPLEFRGYSITSDRGALVQSGWKSIAGNYDNATNGDGSVDNNGEWTILSAAGSKTDLSETEFLGDGGVIAPNSSVIISQGNGAWIPSPNETDLKVEILLKDKSFLTWTAVFEAEVIYTGNGGSPLMRSDLNHDGQISVEDWNIFLPNNPSNFSSLTVSEAYALGDIDGDMDSDLDDFILFRSDFDTANGQGSFASMLQGVPEPSGLALFLGMSVLGIGVFRFKRKALFCTALLGFMLLTLAPTYATVIATEDFESYTPGVIITGGTVGSESPETAPGGTGWDNSDGGWDSSNDPNNDDTGAATIVQRTVTNFASGIDGQSLILEGGANASNIATRRFPTQTGTFFIGMDLKTDNNWADSFFQLYVNDTRANTATAGMGGGINRDNTPGPGPWFARTTTTTIGGSTLDPTIVNRFVVGFSKSSGNPLDNYDTVKVWVNSFDENSPNAEVAQAWTGLQMSILHLRINNQPGLGDTIMVDNLVVATTLSEASGGPIVPLKNFVAEINTVSGEISLLNERTTPITIASYEITSPDGKLLTSFPGMGNRDAVDGPDPDLLVGSSEGETWQHGGNNDSSILVEHFLLGSTTFAPGERISLGKGYMIGAEDANMTFRYYDTELGTIRSGVIEFVDTVPNENADFDGDGDVDGSDFLAWQAGYGAAGGLAQGDANGDGNVNAADLAIWQSHYGSGNGGGSMVGAAVPEPSGIVLLVLAALATAIIAKR